MRVKASAVNDSGPLIHKEVVLICRKQQCSESIPHSHDFAHSKVGESLLIGFLGSFETLCDSLITGQLALAAAERQKPMPT